ncbi:hypothetical protein [Nocardia lijiangensis]|uniref:hypothetical protein n=1 Tax=Nocardia lijiangensis TaxID=299618 RepID=UPI00083676CE|nr:hypothetical protein [Nocardia lijiangensis]
MVARRSPASLAYAAGNAPGDAHDIAVLRLPTRVPGAVDTLESHAMAQVRTARWRVGRRAGRPRAQ